MDFFEVLIKFGFLNLLFIIGICVWGIFHKNEFKNLIRRMKILTDVVIKRLEWKFDELGITQIMEEISKKLKL